MFVLIDEYAKNIQKEIIFSLNYIYNLVNIVISWSEGDILLKSGVRSSM